MGACCSLFSRTSAEAAPQLPGKRGAKPDTLTPLGNELPPVVHAELTLEDTGDGRVIVVGDVHGCLSELKALLEKCGYEHGRDTVVLVGDLVNKGPEPLQVVRYARRMGVRSVRGNHDEAALAAYRAWQQGSPAEVQPEMRRCAEGLLRTWKQYGWFLEAAPEDIAYLAELPFSLSLHTHGVLVVHAGLVPGVPLQRQALYDLIEVRAVGRDGQGWRALPKFPRNAGEPWAEAWQGPRHVIFGHHARRRLQTCRFATGIDTGCVLGDQLTAVVLPRRGDLAARGFRPAAACHAGGKGVTLAALGAELVSVPAARVYAGGDK